MLHPPGFYYVKKPKRFVILSSDTSSERNLSSFFDIKKPRRIEHLQSEEPFSSDPYFRKVILPRNDYMDGAKVLLVLLFIARAPFVVCLATDYGRPMKPFFIEIENFWAWVEKLGR